MGVLRKALYKCSPFTFIYILAVLRDSLAVQGLPTSCRRAVITLTPKKGDLQQFKTEGGLPTLHRLITAFKMLASRLGQVMKAVMWIKLSVPD